jgi:hypothetical protein
MKNIVLKISLFILIGFSLTGCYTVIWTPDQEFPTSNNYYYEENNYYSGGFYPGAYDYYYGYPWWYSITPPVSNTESAEYNRDRNSNTGSLRNTDSGRTSSGDRGVINNPPSTRDSGNKNSGNTSSPPTTEKTRTTPETKSGSSDSGKRDSGSSSGNDVRNNDGNRNSGGKR